LRKPLTIQEAAEQHKRRELNRLGEHFIDITKHFDLDDWRDCRTEHYWETSDKIYDKVKKIQHKINLIEYYNAKGIPKA
jgi:hypothetical protein